MSGQTAPFFEALVHGRGPVKYHRVGFDETLPWLQHQKLKPIVGDCILIDGGIRYESRIEQLSRDARLRSRATFHHRRHHLSFKINKEKFSTVTAPAWLDPAGYRNLLNAIKRGERSDKHFPSSRPVLAVGD